jgi:hypothetical protein
MARKLNISWSITDENENVINDGTIGCDLIEDLEETLEFDTIINGGITFEHVGTRPRDRE